MEFVNEHDEKMIGALVRAFVSIDAQSKQNEAKKDGASESDDISFHCPLEPWMLYSIERHSSGEGFVFVSFCTSTGEIGESDTPHPCALDMLIAYAWDVIKSARPHPHLMSSLRSYYAPLTMGIS